MPYYPNFPTFAPVLNVAGACFQPELSVNEDGELTIAQCDPFGWLDEDGTEILISYIVTKNTSAWLAEATGEEGAAFLAKWGEVEAERTACDLGGDAAESRAMSREVFGY